MDESCPDQEVRAPAPTVAPVEPPMRPWLREFGGLARRAAYHLLHPRRREPCLEGPPPIPLRRVHYRTSDGWQVPVLVMPPAPGGAGEPVIVAHALGLRADAYRIGSGPTLARALARAGFRVYLLAHRGDRDALPPGAPRGFDFDDLLRRDLPAALAKVRADSGFARVHWVGHGLGGQLGLAHAARADDLASVVALCAPTRFRHRVRSESLSLGLAARLLPAWWQLPSRPLAWASVPWVDSDTELLGQVQPGASAGPRLRGVLSWGADDLPVGLLRQVHRWHRRGVWCDRTGLVDYAETLADARGPALVIAASGDRLCPPDSALWACARWGGSAESLILPGSYGHLDPITAESAPQDVFRPVIGWLRGQRRRAWIAA